MWIWLSGIRIVSSSLEHNMDMVIRIIPPYNRVYPVNQKTNRFSLHSIPQQHSQK
jgi:hypothetical protein